MGTNFKNWDEPHKGYEISGTSEIIPGKSSKPSQYTSSNRSRDNEIYISTDSKDYSKVKKSNVWICAILILIFAFIFFYYALTLNQNSLANELNYETENNETTANNFQPAGYMYSTIPEPEVSPEPNAGLDIETIEQLVFEKTNELRATMDTNPKTLQLKRDEKMDELARLHSQDMVERDFFDHVNPDGKDATDRARDLDIPVIMVKAGWQYTGIAENISSIPLGDVQGCGIVSTEEDVAECSLLIWIESLGHYENLVDNSNRIIGIGAAYDSEENAFYITQDFR